MVLAGWFGVATVIKRDVDRLGGDEDHAGRTVLIFVWIGLAHWLWRRRDLRRHAAATSRS